MRITAKFFLFGISLLFCRSLQAQPLELTISPADRAYHLSRLWSEVKYNFVNLDQIKFDADSLYRACLAEAMEAKSDYAYLRLLKRFMAAFNDGHTEFYSRYKRSNDEMDYVPLSLNFYGEKLYITSVRQRPDLDKNWLGAEVLKIDGVSVARYLADTIFPYISASTPQHRLMQCYQSIVYQEATKPLRMEIRQRDGKIKNISVQRNGEATRKIDDKSWGIGSRVPYNAVEFYNLDGGFSYLMVRSFGRESYIADIDRHVENINKSKGLIIDLRHNGGGSTTVAWYLQSLLTPMGVDTFLNFAWQTRINDGVKKANSNWKEEYKPYYNHTALRYAEPYKVAIPDTIERIKVPVVVLIGRYTFSAAEDFLVNMYEVPGRPMLIGEETGGSTGSPLVVEGLPHGGYARICTRRVCFPYSGKPFVNKGIAPDLIVLETIEDHMALCKLELPPVLTPPQIDTKEMQELVERQHYERYKLLLPHDVVVQAAVKELKKQVK